MLLLVLGAVANAADLSLTDAIEQALDHGYGIKAAAGDSAAAASRFQAARTLRFPTLSLDARSYYLTYVPKLTLPFATMELGSKENYQADFKLSLPLYTGGRLSHSIAAARETSRAETSRLEAERMTVAVTVRRSYFNLMLAASSLDIANASLRRLIIIRSTVQDLYDNGLADSVDILDAEATVVKAGRVANQAATSRKNATASLAMLIGVEDDTSITPTEPLSYGDIPDVETLTIPANIPRPELQRFDYLIAASDQSAALAGTDYFPTLAGFGGYSVGKPNKDMFNKSWNDYFSVGLSLAWELNLGGKTGRNVSAAHQAAHSARMSRQSLQEALTVQAETSLNNLKQAFSVLGTAGTEYDIAVRKFNLARQKQKAGELTVNRLLEMEMELTVSEQQHRSAVIQYFLAWTDYLYAIGSPEIYGGLR
ncbi:MAG: TolC family protein [candidate division Zixibacteria bacterium]|nr:TolC family protein [candidate division Zixibacteria bacterium]